MKVLVLSRWFVRWNGMSRVAYEISRRVSRKYDVVVVSHRGYVDKEWEKDVDVVKIGKSPLRPDSIFDVREVILREKPDVIHSHGILGFAAYLSKYPYVVTYHGNWPYDWFLGLKNFVSAMVFSPVMYVEMRAADVVVSVSCFSQRMLRRLFSVDSIVIHNGIDDVFWEKPPICKELDRPALIFIGGVDKRKAGYLPSISNMLLGHAHIYVIGKVIDGSLAAKLSSLPNVTLLGTVGDVRQYLYSGDIFILPSTIEAFPLTVLEAQACGLPVVAFDVGGIREAVVNGRTGYLVGRGDVRKFVRMVMRLISDKKLREWMGSKAREQAEKFRWDNVVKKYIELYKRCCGEYGIKLSV